MTDGVGLSVGATNLAAVVPGRTAVLRTSVITVFGHRPPEVGLPAENPALDARGLVVTDFVDRVGDPVPIVAADGSTHHGAALVAEALRTMLGAVTAGGVTPPPVVTHPAHWRDGAVEALRAALREFGGQATPVVVSDAFAALTALQHDPGVPARGVIAVCDFGGSGTSVTLLDVGRGYRAVAPTLRHRELSGDLVDRVLLTHVVGDLSAAGAVDLSGTSALGSLSRLRAQCRDAKERLSAATVTSLYADLPGHRGEVRLTRTELVDAIRPAVADFRAALRDTLERNGIRPENLAAVATSGGGASIPFLTTALSEDLRVPVITTARPELTAALGAGLIAARSTAVDATTAMSPAPATMMAPAPVDPPAASGGVGALAWSQADDVPEPNPYDDVTAWSGGPAAARPDLMFGAEESAGDGEAGVVPWYRRKAVLLGAGLLALAAAVGGLLFLTREGGTAPPASTTPPAATTTEVPPTTGEPPPAQTPQPPQTQTVTREAPPQTETQAPPPATVEPPPPTEPPPTSVEPPPTSVEPPPTSVVPPPPTEPPPTTRPPLIPTIPTIPPIPTIPGLPPFIPQPGGGGP
ncbi:MAG: Hsp70 family protein [Actinobacteria bacterium]|nr:Hsp70 family protein [Actinomycetota bacterium]